MKFNTNNSGERVLNFVDDVGDTLEISLAPPWDEEDEFYDFTLDINGTASIGMSYPQARAFAKAILAEIGD